MPETAQFLGVSSSYAYRLVARRELPAVIVGNRVLVPRHRLKAWLRDETVPADEMQAGQAQKVLQ